MKSLNYDQLIELYKITVQEKNDNLKNHHDRVAFYTSFFTAVMTLVFGGLLYTKNWYQYLFLCIGPLIIISISTIAKKTAIKTYQIYLETITICAKYEQLLGLTDGEIIDTRIKNQKNCYWQKEPIMVTRYLENRRKYKNSKDFVSSTISKGQLGIDTLNIYSLYKFISFLLLVILIWISISTFK